MTNRTKLIRITPAALVLMLAAGLTLGGDWPRFRGPQGDARSTETGLLRDWPEEGPRILWRTELGSGYSGVSVVGGRLYTMFGQKGDEFAVCLDAADGKEIWRVRVDKLFKNMFGDGPRATPTVDDGVVYVTSARGTLFALAAVDGAKLWVRDFVGELGSKTPQWGFSGSVLIEGKLLIADVGGSKGRSILAFDKRTGKEVWRSQDDKAGYSSPLALSVGERRQVIAFTATSVVALDPRDGGLLWKQPWKTSYDVNAASPVFIEPDRVFVSSGYDVGGAVLRIGASGVEEVWRNREMKNKFQSSVLHEGHLYGFDESTFKCVDAATGALRWRARGLGHGSLLYADGHLLALGDKGTLVLVEATPEEYREKSRAQVFEGKTWTMPTLAGGKLYLRDEGELVSMDISTQKK